MSELRRDPATDRWVIISTKRSARPSDFMSQPDSLNGNNLCPFCAGNEAVTPPEILSVSCELRQNWRVRVVPNKYPALEFEGTPSCERRGPYECMKGVGVHEVIVESPDHEASFKNFSDDHACDIIWVFKERLTSLRQDPRIEHALIFKNHGRAAGASLAHPHTQLAGLPMVPFDVRQELNGAGAYYQKEGRCLYCAINKEELSQKLRLVEENEAFLAFAPYASRFAFEMTVVPKEHSCYFEEMDKTQAMLLARMLKSVLARLDKVLKNPAFNLIIHSAPFHEQGCPDYYHWHIEILPKLAHIAGFEWGSGFYINTVAPENAAHFLREVAVL